MKRNEFIHQLVISMVRNGNTVNAANIEYLLAVTNMTAKVAPFDSEIPDYVSDRCER